MLNIFVLRALFTGGLLYFGRAIVSQGSACATGCSARESQRSVRFQVGTFEIAGPLFGAQSCTLGVPCTLPIAGVNINGSSKVLPFDTSLRLVKAQGRVCQQGSVSELSESNPGIPSSAAIV